MKKLLLAVLVVGFAISSCSIEKRVHRKGFHVEWNKNLGNNKKDKNQASDIETGEETAKNPIKVKTNLKEGNIIVNSTTTDGIEATENQLLTSDDQNLTVSDAVEIAAYNLKRNANVSGVKSTANDISDDVENAVKENKKTFKNFLAIKKAAKGDVPVGLLYVLCFFIPFVAVGLATDWDINKVLINILWSLLCGIPGIIHAIIIVGRNS